MIEAYDWLIAFQGSEGSDQSYCNNELSPFSRGQQMQRGEEHMQKARRIEKYVTVCVEIKIASRKTVK